MPTTLVVSLSVSGKETHSLAGQTLFFSFLFIGGVVGRKIIVWSNSHAKFVLHCQQYFALRQAVVYRAFSFYVISHMTMK